jgi:hypothetical protein
MGIPFFDSNPAIVDELRAMDHGSRAYRKTLQKVLLEIGGLPNLFTALKASPEGDRIRRKYIRQIIVACILILSMFLWIGIAALLVGDAWDQPIVGVQVGYFVVFLAFEIASVSLAMVFAFRGRRTLFEGLGFLVDTYSRETEGSQGQTLTSYRFERTKVNRIAIVLGIAIPVLVFTGFTVFNAFLGKVDDAQPKDFSKAGLTITLTQAFKERDAVSQTATYVSQRDLVFTLKEDFPSLADVGIPSDTTLRDYASFILENNGIDATLLGSEARPWFTYSHQANGKEYSYLVTVYRGSDAYWVVSFACESGRYTASEAQFQKWADTVKLS